MPDVAIIGAGDLGGALAHHLARRDIVRTICLVDDKGQIASGKALDIMQAAPIESFSTRVSGAQDIVSAAGSMVFVLADRAGAGEWQGDDGLTMIGRILGLAESPIVLCAGSAQREIVERGVRALGLRRSAIFGSAPEALAGAIRAHCRARDQRLAGGRRAGGDGSASRTCRGALGRSDDWRVRRHACARRVRSAARRSARGSSVAAWTVRARGSSHRGHRGDGRAVSTADLGLRGARRHQRPALPHRRAASSTRTGWDCRGRRTCTQHARPRGARERDDALKVG